jgi:hypothetical protein
MKTQWFFWVLAVSILSPAVAGAQPSWCADSCVPTSVQACASLKSYNADTQAWEVLCSTPVQADGAYTLKDGDGTMKEDLLALGDGGVGVFVAGGADLGFSSYRKLLVASDLDYAPDQVHVTGDSTAEASATDPVMKNFFTHLTIKIQKQIELKGAPFSKVNDSNVDAFLQVQNDISSIASDSTSLDRGTVKKWVRMYLQDLDRFEQSGSIADRPQGSSQAFDLVLAMSVEEKEQVMKRYWKTFDPNLAPDQGAPADEFRALMELLVMVADRTKDASLFAKISAYASLDQTLFKPLDSVGLKLNYENSLRVNPELVSFLLDVYYQASIQRETGDSILRSLDWWNALSKRRCESGFAQSCDTLKSVEALQSFFKDRQDQGLSLPSYQNLDHPDSSDSNPNRRRTHYQALYDVLYRSEKPAVGGFELKIQKLVGLMNEEWKRLAFDSYIEGLRPDLSPDDGSDWSPLKGLIEVANAAAGNSYDHSLIDLTQRLGSDTINVPLQNAGGLPFNIDTLTQVNPEFMNFLNLIWYQVIIQSNRFDFYDRSLEWWQRRDTQLCDRGDKTACRAREAIDQLREHVVNLKQSGMVLRSYADFNTWAPGDPDGVNFQELYDGLFGRIGAFDASWITAAVSAVSSQTLSASNPDLEGLYQDALKAATASFLNREDLVSDRDDFNEKIKVYQSQLSSGDENAASTLTGIRDHRRKGMLQIWKNTWQGAIEDAAANGNCAEGVDCSLDALSVYAEQRGVPPMPDMTLIGTDEAKKLLQ